MVRLWIFLLCSLVTVVFSWPWLRSVGSHGFWRFLAFECLYGLVLLQTEVWFSEPFSAHQVISWVFLGGSLVLAIHGFTLLLKIGKPVENIEQTTVLITVGAYRYIRHPLYCSLLLGALGVLCKSFTVLTAFLTLASCACIIATAVFEERENLERFGPAYASYRERTWMFIPGLF